MKVSKNMPIHRHLHTATECLSNGRRLLDDAEFLRYQAPPMTAFAIVIIAEEELAKSFILALVHNQVIEWNDLLWKAARSHSSKHLIGLVLEHLAPDLDEWSRRDGAAIAGIQEPIPPSIIDALNLFRHARGQSFWDDGEPIEYDQTALRVSKGKMDRLKQDQLYVSLGKDGAVCPRIIVDSDTFEAEMGKAERMVRFLDDLLRNGVAPSPEWNQIRDCFEILFRDLKEEPPPECEL